ncbi:MAG: GTPase HflX [Christensenellales bacterium]|jgi:GTP-binding protein HflX
MIGGNTQSIRDQWLKQMEGFYEVEAQADAFLSHELIGLLVRFTHLLGKEISLYLARDGAVVDVTVGEPDRVDLPDIRLRRGDRTLSGVRCVHSHPGGDARLSSVDLQALQRMRFDAMASVGVSDEGQPTGIQVAILGEEREPGRCELQLWGPGLVWRMPDAELFEAIEREDAYLREITRTTQVKKSDKERVLLIGLETGDGLGEGSLAELGRLADTAGGQVVGQVLQKRDKPDPALVVGSGKLADIALLAQSLDADLVIFDVELTGAQTRNIERVLSCRVIDRTCLILDIFAKRAQTREGKLQVELAQLNYRLPRLTGMGMVLSRLGGGIGTVGPGETKLEIDRRRIRRRIYELGQEIQKVSAQRQVRRSRRDKLSQLTVALVGYTNAGKSTLLNTLTGSDVLSEDKLFATLDPVTRRLRLPGGVDVLLVDTVGFIHKLPHDLVQAFQATLEEAVHADLLLHVMDASAPDLALQKRVVEQVLDQLGAGDHPRINVLNKIDQIDADQLPILEPPCVCISARQGEGLEQLRQTIAQALSRVARQMEYLIPYDKSALVGQLHEMGQVLQVDYEPEGARVRALMDARGAERFARQLNG